MGALTVVVAGTMHVFRVVHVAMCLSPILVVVPKSAT